MRLFKKIFGSKNERELKKMQPSVDRINSLRDQMEQKSDAELQAMTGEFREKLSQGASVDDIMHEAFAVVREGAWRTLHMRHFDVQLIGGMVLHRGQIAEMRTGEGKTLTATLPAYLNGLTGKGLHVVTVNDYLASRDAEWMGQIYNFLGLSWGTVVHGVKDEARQQAYMADITYGQNNEFGFDYLRDNMKMSPDRMVQRGHAYAIVDEVDSILVDEARTPLIISGPAEESATLYTEVDKVVPRLKRDVEYTVDEKAHSTMLTDAGVERVQKLLGVDNLYDPDNISYNHHITQALRAHTLYKRDVNYLVDAGKIVIVDEFTGRKMPGRRWSDGLHQAIEAKEGVTIEEENQTLATITFQNYFRMYDKLSGMTGTADTEAPEFAEIYKLDVMVIPTNEPLIRDDQPDLVYKNEKGKFHAVLADLIDCHERGQPVLVGTVSVEKSEVLASLLKRNKIPFNVLNAKQHGREAMVVAQAGRKSTITISTNMAGRGTDIVLGGNAEAMAKRALTNEIAQVVDKEGPEGHPYRDAPNDEDKRLAELTAEFGAQCKAEREEVLAAGGLKIIGTERHESRRIDNQLRGRAGRQGDPGASRFYLSLEDDLLRIFGADRIKGLMERLGMEDDVPIEHSWVTKAIENAQKKVEGHNFDQRKNVLEYDNVMNQQRKTIYALRRQILDGRYAPEPNEEDLKAGAIPEPPTTSGDWTIDKLADDDLEKYADTLLEGVDAIEEKIRAGAELVPGQAPWRVLRNEIWRQTGTLLDTKSRTDGPRSELKDFIVQGIAASLIQQRERLYDLCDGLIGNLIDANCPPQSHEDDWDLDALESGLEDLFNTKFEIDRKGNPEHFAEAAWSAVEKRIDEREEELGRPFLLYFTRHFYLEEIDTLWIEHLKTMDHLREGIYLRGYGQKDPKKEYKKEGFELFGAMMGNIQVNVTRKIFHVQIERERAEEEIIPELKAKQRQMNAVHPSSDGGGDSDSGGGSSAYGDAADGGKSNVKQQTVRRETPKVGRNDPCPCGSGKKYKKCCGRPGAAATV